MAGPYDYTVNIPQPPANNFLQTLMGIQQLKGLRQQQELSQQQAGIQAQQAQFAQQEQPLREQQLQAQIAASQASAAQAGAATATSNYNLDQRKALDADLLGMSSDPAKFTADNLQNLAVKFHSVDPTLFVRAGEMRKNMPDQAKIFGDNIAKNLVLTSVNGDSEEAIKQLDESLKAAKNTPELQSLVPKIEKLKDNFIKYPDQTVAIAAVGQTLFAPDQGKAITDVLSEQAKIKETQAKTKETEAKAVKEQYAAMKISQEIENGKPMSRPVTNIVDAATTASQSFGKISETAQSLKSELESMKSKMDSGKWTLMGKEAWKSATATQDEVSNFLTGFDRLVTSDLFKSLKDSTRGTMNVQELKTVGGTVPGKYDSAQRKAEYLDSIISSFDRQTQLESDKANFVSTFNTNGKAPKDGEVSGIPVSKGTTLNDFLTQRKKELGGIKVFGGAPVPTKTEQITGTPALVPAGGTPADVDAILKQFGVKK